MGLLIFTPKEIKLLRLHNLDLKHLLLPLLAALALPTAASAESHWLIIKARHCGVSLNVECGVALEKIEMKSLAQCEKNGEKWLTPYRSRMGYSSNYKKPIRKTSPADKEKGDLMSAGRSGESYSYICLTGK